MLILKKNYKIYTYMWHNSITIINKIEVFQILQFFLLYLINNKLISPG